MTSAHLQQWIQNPELLNRDTLYELRTLVARYPYFQTLRLLYLKNLYLLHDINFGAELRKSVLYVSDRRVLFYLIEGDRYQLHSSRKSPWSLPGTNEEPNVDRTLSLIDAFLATLPEEQPQELDYTMDYTAYLLEEPDKETPLMRGHELIDGFIGKDVKIEETDVRQELSVDEDEDDTADTSDNMQESANLVSDEDCFTETLAKIYVKQQRYDKALEIIKKLSLNYPKKNAYFADQIRFLEKLIINAKSK